MRFFSNLISMFISREREYRADAIAVRLTRDPLSLAEALYKISFRWKGSGLPAQEMDAIFIVNPEFEAIDESEGFLADLFSTHPPVKTRLQILLDMAHINIDSFLKQPDIKENRFRTTVPTVGSSSNQWMIQKDGQWTGPFGILDLATLNGFNTETWVQKIGSGEIKPAYEEKEISSLFKKESNVKSVDCPKCKQPLVMIDYEGVKVEQCSYCKGNLVHENNVLKIKLREEVGFPQSVIDMAKIIKKKGQLWSMGRGGAIKKDPLLLYQCPYCHDPSRKMYRRFYNSLYQIEVDICLYCQYIWFDKDELEVLQCLVENEES